MAGQMATEEPLSTVEDPSAPSGVGFGDGGDALIADIGPPVSPRRAHPVGNDPDSEPDASHDAEGYEPLVDLDEIPDLAMEDNMETVLPTGSRTGSPPTEARIRSPPRMPPEPPELPKVQSGDGIGTVDFLLLGELKDLLPQAPKEPPSAYAYKHGNCSSYVSEIEEWFGALEDEEGEMLLESRASFDRRWTHEPQSAGFWDPEVDDTERIRFVRSAVHQAETSTGSRRQDALLCILYIAMGDWSNTAGKRLGKSKAGGLPGSIEAMSGDGRGDAAELPIYQLTDLQRERMIQGAELLTECEAIPVLYDIFREVCSQPRKGTQTTNGTNGRGQAQQYDESSGTVLDVVLLLLYLLVEAGRELRSRFADTSIRVEIAALEPDFLPFLVKTLSKLRWSEAVSLPLSKLLLLYWKSLLLLLGSSEDLKATKKYATKKAGLTSCPKHKQIRSSPLDYHLFRQEITSKYPGYHPPPAQLPLEPEESTVLPSFSEISRKKSVKPEAGSASFAPGTSIFEQPVHIATPAPSPPPTPAGAGKTLRKINYQTNQQFPMLYPPVNVDGDPFGDSLPSGTPDFPSRRKWDDDHVPASILEAGNLFSSRSELTLPSKQLWDEKEAYQAHERGRPIKQTLKGESNSPGGSEDSNELRSERVDEKLQDAEWTLEFLEDFYREIFPNLQSLVVVLFKEMQYNIRQLMNPPNTQTNGLTTALPSTENMTRPPPPVRSNTSIENIPRTNASTEGRPQNLSQSGSMDASEIRVYEISLKAIAGIFINMLRWFKVSHILKFEYLAQLLFDIDLLSRVLMFANQDLDITVNSTPDDPDGSVFNFLLIHSGNLQQSSSGADSFSQDEESDDAACPPPIKLNRNVPESESPKNQQTIPPEVTELGNPVDTEMSLPLEPVTSFSFRTLFTMITLLQIVQKLVKHKTHRNIALVNFKSSQYLRRALRIPQPDLRLYALKLFKGQIPFCGRKWRQGNMRVITAVYLYCWPELRDEWLCGGDMDHQVEEALPIEQSLRALTHWYNVRRYPEGFRLLGEDGRGLRKAEQDFFERELEAMGLGSGSLEGLADEEERGGGIGEGGQQMQQQQQQQQRIGGVEAAR